MNGVRIFLCFDVDHDKDLGARLCEQSQRADSSFTVAARSEPGVVTDGWCDAVRRRMREADEVVVICGEHTADSERVDAELRIAQEEQKPHFLLWGRRDEMCTMPARVTRAGCMYSWTWEILTRQVTDTLRNARPLEVPEECKRP